MLLTPALARARQRRKGLALPRMGVKTPSQQWRQAYWVALLALVRHWLRPPARRPGLSGKPECARCPPLGAACLPGRGLGVLRARFTAQGQVQRAIGVKRRCAALALVRQQVDFSGLLRRLWRKAQRTLPGCLIVATCRTLPKSWASQKKRLR